MYCEGHFLGLTVCNAADTDTRLTSSVYEYDVDDDVTDDAAEQFDDMMRNLGAVGLLEKFVYYYSTTTTTTTTTTTITTTYKGETF